MMDVTGLSPTRKRFALLILIVGTGLIVERVIAFGGDASEGVGAGPAEATEAAVAQRGAPDETPTPRLLRLDRLEARRSVHLEAPPVEPLFAPLSWSPPRPKVAAAPPPPPQPPPKPMAPAFPYPYIGGLWEDGVRTGFFTRGERVLAVRAGDMVDAAFRVERIDDTQMSLTYLPLEQSLTVVFGGPK